MSLRVAVVTGANKGIGFEIAKKLVQSGVHTIITARDVARGQRAVKQLQASLKCTNLEFAQLDLDSKDSVHGFVSWLQKTHGGLDVLVNNAGIAFKAADPTPFAQQAKPTFKTNYFATQHLTVRLLPLLRPNGRIVNIASQAGSMAFAQMSPALRANFTDPGLTLLTLESLANDFVAAVEDGTHKEKGWASTCYGTSKLSVIAMTAVLAKQPNILERKISVFSCCPGWCNTDMSSGSGNRTAEQGAVTPFKLATATSVQGHSGGFFLRRKDH